MKLFIFFISILIISCSREDTRSVIAIKPEWKEFNSKDSIPKQLNAVLFALNGETKIANPNEDYNATDVVEIELLDRKLRLLSKKDSNWRMIYEEGGIANYDVYIECEIRNDSLFNVKIGYPSQLIETNDNLTAFLKQGKMQLHKMKVSYK
ncbi:hypothetical protein EZ428_15965 [Pedobacter frigiditerrae]|uniref:Lipoprotein n=1 Tax=Pedobacter frigiditerrae TaxID=2530452 RepID=A0A4R0MRI3_9SPHI|nr:hypothetical protein [Pedobacter frigiditerrae]TCC89197.1 hypothetical protein EZ428_15965 [Pedobacter frigiditerrae]